MAASRPMLQSQRCFRSEQGNLLRKTRLVRHHSQRKRPSQLTIPHRTRDDCNILHTLQDPWSVVSKSQTRAVVAIVTQAGTLTTDRSAFIAFDLSRPGPVSRPNPLVWWVERLTDKSNIRFSIEEANGREEAQLDLSGWNWPRMNDRLWAQSQANAAAVSSIDPLACRPASPALR